jgi:hypothetical protein
MGSARCAEQATVIRAGYLGGLLRPRFEWANDWLAWDFDVASVGPWFGCFFLSACLMVLAQLPPSLDAPFT